MIIYRTQDNNGTATIIEVADVPVTAKAVHKATLMKEDFIKLVFESDTDYKLMAGDWIELESGGMPYVLADDYIPTMKDEATFSYELQFNAPWYNLYQRMFLFNTYVNGSIVKRESDWYITDTAKNILSLIIRTTRDEDRHCPCVFNEVLDCEPTVVKTFTFSSTSILSALNNLAKEFELEWWVTYEDGEYYLHFGECDNSITRDANGAVTFDGETNVRERNSALAVHLSAGVNVTKPSVSQKDGLKRKYYVFGSSRNIDQNAVQDMENGFVTSIVTKRLELAGNPQDMGVGSGEEVVIFDDIYPRSDYQITGVTPVEIITDEVLTYDEQGNPSEYKRYNVYNLQIEGFSDYIFSLINSDPNVQNVEDIIASGKPLSLKFITKDVSGETVTPKLAGFEFELAATLVTDENTGDRWYEFQIQHQDINGYIIPNDNLIPEAGDWVCIFNVKGAYIGGTNSNNGQDDLRAAFNKWYANKKRDVSYTVKPYANEDIDLEIGDAVVLSYKDNTVTSRVYSYEKALDLLLAGLGCSDASYTISSYAKTGSVNQLKEDVKVLTASIANGTAGGGIDASSVQNAIATYGRRLFLSKTTEDKADGHITFKEGITSQKDSSLQRTTYGTFESGFLGSGAVIDEYGNAEVKSLYSREFISTPEFRFNRITVTEGEQWNTNAFGIIEDVRKINGNDCIVLKLEEGDLPSVKYGDLCRGIYSNIGYAEENNAEPYDLTAHNASELDDCNFPTKVDFFTSYFQVLENPKFYTDEDGKKHWYFRFITKSQQVNGTDTTPLPCKNMKFAQYGNPFNSDRQSSFYQTSIRHSYIQQLEGVDSWEIHPWNIASRYGYLGDLTVTLKNSDGSTYNTTLNGNGLYVQDNVYFGNATIQLDPVTIEDIKRQLANYSVHLSAYTDVIKVDDAGNVIEGLWNDTGEAPNISRQYRIFSVITARNGITPLTIEEGDVPCGAGKFKVYVQPYGCSCKIENSTLFITHIDNVKDGVAGTEDDVNFDYDACRAMERVWVDLRVECEGVGSILTTMPITIKHDPVPYVIADLTNENASVSWSTEFSSYVGLPLETLVNMAKGNENLPITNISINSINGITPNWVAPRWSSLEQAYIYEDTNPSSSTYGWRFLVKHSIGGLDNPLAGSVLVDDMPQDADDVTELLITCSTNYAGVQYERTLSMHISRFVDVAIWDIIPTHRSVSVDRNAFFNYPYVGVNIFCTDKSGRRAVTTLPSGFRLMYKISEVISSFTPVLNPTGNPAEQGWFELDTSGGEVLPYDAQVEYLQSSGTQYIDTGIVGNQNTKVEIKAMPHETGTMFVYGSRGDNTNDITFCTGNGVNNRFDSQTFVHTTADNTAYEVVQNKTKITINGVDNNYGSVSNFVTPTNLYIMTASESSTYKFSGKIYYMRIWNGDTLARDFIPVRVGQVGYMYDKVSGQLFGNSGTGSFTLGSEVTQEVSQDQGSQSQDYVVTTDTSVVSGKTYYVYSYASVDSAPVILTDPTAQVRVNDPSYADTIKSIIFTLFNEASEVADEEEVLVIREGIGGQGSTGPAGNGVQQVTDYYLRAKDGFTPHYPDPLGYIPVGDDADLVETSQAYPSGWRANTFTAPVKEWPNVWHFTKYDYTHAPDYDTTPALLTKFSEDGNSIIGVHAYYLRTNEGNVNNILRLDQGGTGWLEDEFVEPDNSSDNGHGRFVWRYLAFQYSKAVNGTYYAYTPIEFVAKFVEDGTSFQCAYKVFPAKVDGSDYSPTLDNVSTGAEMPKTNNSSWSGTTTGLVVGKGQFLWMTQRTYRGSVYNAWGTPVRISGDTGEAGADGTDIEFIYKLSNDGNPTLAEKPTDLVNGQPWSGTDIHGDAYSFDDDDFNPSRISNAANQDLGWTDNPSGVSTEYKYEWACQRTKKKGSEHWGGWTSPFVWSAYGDRGMDGDGVEYVFTQTPNADKPSSPVLVSTNGVKTNREYWYGGVYEENGLWLPKDWKPNSGYEFVGWEDGYYDGGEWIPELKVGGQSLSPVAYWTDNPTGVDGNNTREWVSVRKRVNGRWEDFSNPPALWATYSETPNIHIVNGYWYNGDNPMLDDKGNPVKAEGEDGTGVNVKGEVDVKSHAEMVNGGHSSCLQDLEDDLAAQNKILEEGDAYVVNSNRHLFVYNGDSRGYPYDWSDIGEFKGADGKSEYVHIAWATGMLFINGVKQHPVVVKNGVEQSNYFDVVQQSGVEYEWMGICTSNSENNPNHVDPSENIDWVKYEWNHIKGRDGADYERVYYRSEVEVRPQVVASDLNPDNNGRLPNDAEYLPIAQNHESCNPESYGDISEQFTDDPIGVSEEYPYEWVAERKKVDGVWGAFGVQINGLYYASLWAKYSKDGEKGDGVTLVNTYYLKTTMSSGVNYTTDEENWVLNVYQVPDEDKPYVWRYTESYVGQTLVGRSGCELIAVFNSAPNVNLLDDTAFSSDAAMEAWRYKGYVSEVLVNGVMQSADPTADPNSPNYDSQSFNNYFGVTTGTQGYNAYLGRFRGTNPNAYIILLQQNILSNSVTKIEAGRWYTLSYWVRGNSPSMFSVTFGGTAYIDQNAGMYVNGSLIKNTNSHQFKYSDGSYSNSWTKHTITFKTLDSLTVGTSYIQWSMYDRTTEHQVYICMPKLEVGLVATTYSNGQTSTKAFPRTGKWERGEQYYAGNIGERYIDARYYGLNNFGYPAWFKCIKTHISSDENSPTSANGSLYWDAGSWDGFTATGLLLAQYAFVENLGVGILRTGEPEEPHVEMFDSIARFFGEGGHKSIELATDDDGVGVLRFYDKSGNAMYDLGPNGIMENFSQVPTSYSSEYYEPIASNNLITALVVVGSSSVSGLGESNSRLCYKLSEGYKSLKTGSSVTCTYNISGSSTPSAWNGARVKLNTYTDNQLQGTSPVGSDKVLADGWYCGVWVGIEGDFRFVEIYHFTNGKIITTKKVYFKENDLIANGANGSWYDSNGNRHIHQPIGEIMTDD